MSRSSESSIVTKCARVMDVLTHAKQPLAFSDIVAKTGFVKSSCHRILAVLQGEGLVAYHKDKRSYAPGPRFHDWARAGFHRVDLQQIAADPMEELLESTRMNAALSVLDGFSLLYLRTADNVSMRYAARAGDRAPLHCTAAGKVFLAHMPEPQLEEFFATTDLEKSTEFTRTDAETLTADFPAIHENGYASAIKEEFLQVMGIAAPIWDERGKVAACLSLWTLTADTDPVALLEKAGRLKKAAAKVTRAIQGEAPD
ncbi:IclR family transcriptional regulator [Primorskyibacter sedentarius]|uniref:IclR family transcriptional regulator n=1 Tax=Primorskyibacter sedentarius TaxID=745311 RepID=A0A4R3J9Y0_9RHOB|nr:IclR family transcriptional regulator [Primorskyibacter sedentarius]TCS62759.1 IclR family transcriptional regulator [Primorskyibacter sedentarius]